MEKKKKKTRAERRSLREERYTLLFSTIQTSYDKNPDFDMQIFLKSLPSEFRGLACLAERDFLKMRKERKV